MFNLLFNIFKRKTIFQGLSLEEVEVLSLPRSASWKKLRKEHIKNFPCCAVCGSIKNVVPHHIIPFHIDPSKELDPNNLISLCESDTFNCHLFFGHFKNWTKYNPDVVKDSFEWNTKLKKINTFVGVRSVNMEIKDASKYSIRNKDSIEKSNLCSCYYCFSTFKKEEITNWTDSMQTAICPKCSVDSVLGDSIITFDKDFFEKLHNYWF